MIKLHITNELPEAAGTTVGFWRFEQPNNKGILHIYCVPLPKRRYIAAVVGHELLEALFCKLFHRTTEVCDLWDIAFEKRYESGEFPYTFESGFHKDCPYHWGHVAGAIWEYLFIYCTCWRWSGYETACLSAMGIEPED